ncbi:MAG TPA: 4'-phosphopantetheinyl transferase superfamily protein [Longimicrobiaceae bacterium]|nr:4'-phosphopantetheinyl transferase superfamily protein [Longimicrobiaceae bacterium]
MSSERIAVGARVPPMNGSGAMPLPKPPGSGSSTWATRILTRPDVHVWCVTLDVDAAELGRLRATLSPEEATRADRFVRLRDAEHFIAARGALRTLLGRYLRVPPGEVAFCYGAHGKPALAEEFAEREIRFNLSHSHGLALLALARREVGIDLEFIAREVEHEQIATRFFSRSERAAFLALPPAQRSEAFFRCWTRKEAYIKALGEGLSHPLADFDVTLVPGAPARLLATRRDAVEAARWEMVDLTPRPGYAGALVMAAATAPPEGPLPQR